MGYNRCSFWDPQQTHKLISCRQAFRTYEQHKNLNQNRNPKQTHYESTQNTLQKGMSDCPLKTNAEQQQFVKQTKKLCLFTPRCGIAPLILNCCNKWGLVVTFKPRSSYRLDKSFRYRRNRRIVGHHNRSGRFAVKPNVLPLRDSNRNPSIGQPVV